LNKIKTGDVLGAVLENSSKNAVLAVVQFAKFLQALYTKLFLEKLTEQ
jgi:hypothetical protein